LSGGLFTPGKGALTEAQVMALISKFFPPNQRALAKKISFLESRWKIGAAGKNKNRTIDYGLFQINTVQFACARAMGISVPDGLLNPVASTAVAAAVVELQGWGMWTTAWENGFATRGAKPGSRYDAYCSKAIATRILNGQYAYAA
jgi:Transglycosylase SLT domain